MKVGVFGGSFDPPHIGHSAIIKHIKDGGLLDRVIVMPCFDHPFNKKMTSYDMRTKMCELAFAEFGSFVTISDLEKRQGGISHTVRTLKALKKLFPDDEFYLVFGGDVKKEISDWKHSDEIMQISAGSVDVPRGKGSFIPDVSSSLIRDLVASGGDYGKFVLPKVADYIRASFLYAVLSLILPAFGCHV